MKIRIVLGVGLAAILGYILATSGLFDTVSENNANTQADPPQAVDSNSNTNIDVKATNSKTEHAFVNPAPALDREPLAEDRPVPFDAAEYELRRAKTEEVNAEKIRGLLETMAEEQEILRNYQSPPQEELSMEELASRMEEATANALLELEDQQFLREGLGGPAVLDPVPNDP